MRKNIFLPALIGSGTGLAAACVLLLLFAGVSLRADDPVSLVPVLSAVALFAGAAGGGWAAGRIAKESGLLCGAIAGTVYAFICGVGSVVLKSTKNSFVVIALCLGLIAVSAVLGRLALPRSLSPKQRYRKQAHLAMEKAADKKTLPIPAAGERQTPSQTGTGRKSRSRHDGSGSGQSPHGYLT